MKLRLEAFFGLLLVSLAAHGQAITDPSVGVTYDQRLGQKVPTDILLRDETGARRSLGDWIDQTPTVLVFGYTHCGSLCPTLLQSTATALARTGLAPGQDWHGLFVSIDPAEQIGSLASMKAAQIPAALQPAWHFTTSDDGSAIRLANDAGFDAQFDKATSQFAHAAGLVVLSPRGRIVRYFFGAGFKPALLRQALLDAHDDQPQAAATPLLLVCFHLVAPNGFRSIAIMDVLRTLSALFAAGLAYALWRRRRTPVSGAAR